MAKSRKAKSSAVSAKKANTSHMFSDLNEAAKDMKEEHRTFSHVMYVLFLIAVAIAGYFTFEAFRGIALDPNFYGVLGILMLAWAYIFWRFAHEIHG